MNQGFASISIDATPPKQNLRYVNEISRVDSLFNQHYTESIMTIYTVDLYVFDIFLKHDTNHSRTPCIKSKKIITK